MSTQAIMDNDMDLLPRYVKQFFSLYSSVLFSIREKQEQPFYRVIKNPIHDDNHIYFQIIGTSNILKMLPEKIMRDNILFKFNKTDMVLITHLGTKREAKSFKNNFIPNNFFKILKQIIHKGKTFFVVETTTGEVLKTEAQNLYDNDILANNFCGRDGMKIGYTAAEEHYNKIIQFKKTK